jgi:GntR family transcriptional regulator, transcriptional repressor for pyruvate dehydrogenase complex
VSADTQLAEDLGPPGERRASQSIFVPVRTRLTFENVLDQIVDKIQSGLIGEGQFLPSERTLAEVMNVSRRTVREAVRVLSDTGVVKVLPGSSGGIQVASIWVPAELVLAKASPLQPDQVFQVLEARRTLEPRIAQLAAVRAADEHFDAMRKSIELQRCNQDDRHKVSLMNARFHRLLWRAAGNETLEGAMRLVYRQLEIVLDMTVRTPSDTERSISIHERTLDALMKGDTADVEEAMDEHMAYLENICESVLGRRRIRTLPDFLQTRQPIA